MTQISMDKKYQYRNGEPARVLCVDAGGKQPVVSVDKFGEANNHKSDGRYYFTDKLSSYDLIEVVPIVEYYVPISEKSGWNTITETRAVAAQMGIEDIAKVSFQNGKLISVEIVE